MNPYYIYALKEQRTTPARPFAAHDSEPWFVEPITEVCC
jgi:hypothetical protein